MIMKKMKFLSTILLAVMTMSTMIACSGSDDEDSPDVKRQLVGVWKTTMSAERWRYIEIKADGNLICGYSVNEDGTIREDSHDYSWIYNESDQTITLYNKRYNTDKVTYIVSMANDGNSWNGRTTSGSICSFIRVMPK